MATEILAVGSAAASSADFVVAGGSTATVALKAAAGPDVPGNSQVNLLLKADNNEYFLVDSLSSAKPALVIGPGTYRLTRVATGSSVGVFSA
jgi:hypothetical protein